MRRALPAVIGLLALAAAPPAPAKGPPESGTICGADGCVTTRDRDRLQAVLYGGPPTTQHDPHPAYFTVRIAVAARPGEQSFTEMRWAPASGLLRFEDELSATGGWWTPDDRASALLAKLTHDLRPFGATSPPSRPRDPDRWWIALVGVPLAGAELVSLALRRRRVAAGLTVLALAAIPAAAYAKELSSAEICGAGGCRTMHDRAELEALGDISMPTGAPGTARREYTISMEVTHEGEHVGAWTLWWSPDTGAIRRQGEDGRARWYEPSAPALAALRRVTAGLRAYGEPPARPASRDAGGGAWHAWGPAAAIIALLAGILGARALRGRVRPRRRGGDSAGRARAEGPE